MAVMDLVALGQCGTTAGRRGKVPTPYLSVPTRSCTGVSKQSQVPPDLSKVGRDRESCLGVISWGGGLGGAGMKDKNKAAVQNRKMLVILDAQQRHRRQSVVSEGNCSIECGCLGRSRPREMPWRVQRGRCCQE